MSRLPLPLVLIGMIQLVIHGHSEFKLTFDEQTNNSAAGAYQRGDVSGTEAPLFQ